MVNVFCPEIRSGFVNGLICEKARYYVGNAEKVSSKFDRNLNLTIGLQPAFQALSCSFSNYFSYCGIFLEIWPVLVP